MQHPDEGIIHAWLDGALSPEESASLEAHAASCSHCSAAIAEARGLVAASSRIVSALDIVPAGVIPARKPVTRPWYTRTQFRAAAAVIFIAGTSIVLARGRGTESLADVSQRVMSEQAPPAVAEANEDAAATKQAPGSDSASDLTSTANTTARRKAPTAEFDGRGAAVGTAGAAANVEQLRAADAAGVPAPPSPPAVEVAAPPPVAELRDTAALAKSAVAAPPVAAAPIVVTGVVVTGAASVAQKVSSDLRILAVDSTSSTRVTRYRIASGAELTLTELENSFSGRGVVTRERRFDAARTTATPSAPSPVAAQAATADASRAEVVASLPVLTITWTDPVTQRVYTLSGRVSKETLEEVKAKIQSEKR